MGLLLTSQNYANPVTKFDGEASIEQRMRRKKHHLIAFSYIVREERIHISESSGYQEEQRKQNITMKSLTILLLTAFVAVDGAPFHRDTIFGIRR